MLLLGPLAAWAQEPVLPCRDGAPIWHSCFGVENLSDDSRYVGDFMDDQYSGLGRLIFPEGGEYVGQFRGGKPEGQGVEYRPDGSVRSQGRWTGGRLTQSMVVDPIALIQSRQVTPADRQLARALAQRSVEGLAQRKALETSTKGQVQEAFDITAKQDLPWTEQIRQALKLQLMRWLAPPADGLGPVPAPAYPPPVSAVQEVWETNREFEQRVERARQARRAAVEKIKAEHTAAVNRRNEWVNKYNALVSERWSQRVRYRRSLIEYALSRSRPPVKLGEVTFDRQSGHLHISAEIAGFAPQSFVLTDTQQAFRRIALTQPQSLRASPGFKVTEAGELVWNSLVVQADDMALQATSSASATSSVTTLTFPEAHATAAVAAQEVVFAPDDGAQEQVVFRDRN
jgi:hypothetical protein